MRTSFDDTDAPGINKICPMDLDVVRAFLVLEFVSTECSINAYGWSGSVLGSLVRELTPSAPSINYGRTSY